MPGKFNFFFRKTIKDHQQDNPGHANLKGHGTNALRMRLLNRKILPLIEIKSLERTIVVPNDDVRVALEEQNEGAFGRTNVDRLPQTIKNEHWLVQIHAHNPVIAAETNTLA